MRVFKLVLPLALPAATACQAPGQGPAATTTVERAYMIPMDRVWERGLGCLKEAEFRIEGEKRDGLIGEISARRSGGDRVRIVMKNIDEKHTLVMVRVDQGDSGLAGLLHERLAMRLGLGEAMGEWFGGISIEAEYDGTLDNCVAASRQAVRSLNLVLTGGDLQGDEARIEARTDLSNPLGIKIVAPKSGGKTLVTFLAGTEKDEENKDLARKLKDEFERALKELQ